MTVDHQILTLEQVDALVRGALAGCGATGDQLEFAAQSIVDAECDGIRTVGLGYLPVYCEHLQVGKINKEASPEHQAVSPSAIRSQANCGFAHAAYGEAEADFYALVKQQGIACLSIVDSYSAGVVGWFVQRIAEQGLIGIGFANSSSAVAPAPGASPFFGTNPLAFSIPRATQPPLIADMSTSQVAYVTIKKAAEDGSEIPPGWGYDSDGNDTVDPKAILDGGAMAPMGGYKGMLLGLLVDVLAGVLSGPNCSFQASDFVDNSGSEPKVGQFFIAISPGSLSPAGQTGYAARLEAMLAALSAEPGVRLPGVRRHEFRAQAEQNGVVVEQSLIDRLENYVRS